MVTDYAYDALNRPTAKTFPASPAEDVAYTYDAATPGVHGIGRLTGIADEIGTTALAYDARGNVTLDSRTIGGVAHETRYAYDLADNLARIVHPSGRIVAYGRDALGRVSAITLQDDAAAAPVAVASDIAYHPFGPVASLTFGNGVTVAYAYDQNYRLTDIDAADGVASVQDLTLGYDLSGDITAITDNLDAARSQSFGYDARHRLTTATRGTETLDYGYDDVGNRLDRLNGVAETYAYAPDSNRLQSVAETVGATTRTLTHDLAGNITDDTTTGGADYDFAYNGANRLALVTLGGVPDTEYRYNALGQRVAKAAPGGADTRQFHYDRAGRLIAESDGAGAFLAGYIYLDGLPVAQILPGSNSGAPADASLDNAEPGTAAVGAWASATAGAGYEGADYMVHGVPDPVPAGGTVVDNASGAFSVTGLWDAATAGAGFEGLDYLTRSANGPVPAEIMIDNTDADFSTIAPPFAPWTARSWTGHIGPDYLYHAPDAGPIDTFFVDNRDAGFSADGWWGWSDGGSFGPWDFWGLDYRVKAANGGLQPVMDVTDNAAPEFAQTTGTWAVGVVSGGHWGRTYALSGAGTGAGNPPTHVAAWTPSIAAAATYAVFAAWPASGARASDAPFTIHHAGGAARSDKRRVGKESCMRRRSRWSLYH